MTAGLRRFTLTAHVTSSVGWLGAVATYLVIAVAALRSSDSLASRSGFLAMELIGWRVIIPLALAALVTGLVQALGTQWGLFDHYWVATKLGITLVATAILLMHMPTVSKLAAAAASGPVDFVKLGAPPMQPVVHAGGGLLFLLAATVLSIYKPWGRTVWGRRKRSERGSEAAAMSPRALLIALAAVAAVALVLALHLLGLAPTDH